jgi:hypothetical protein
MFTLFASLLGDLYPPIKDAVLYVIKRRGTFTSAYKEHLKKMVTFTEEDLAKLKGELEELRKVCSELNLPMAERGNIPWYIPHDKDAYLTWRYRRTSRKIENLCKDFRASMDGIIDVIACCAGITEGVNVTAGAYDEPDWTRNLGRDHEDLRDKLKSPSQYSINEMTNAMDQFLDQCRRAMQQLSRDI